LTKNPNLNNNLKLIKSPFKKIIGGEAKKKGGGK
jgi:hypothetical protein